MKAKTKLSPKRNQGMGRFSVEVELANNEDLIHAKAGILTPQQVRRVTVSGVVDSGATRLVLPKTVADALGLPTRRKVRVRYADGRRGFRNEVGGVHLTLQ